MRMSSKPGSRHISKYLKIWWEGVGSRCTVKNLLYSIYRETVILVAKQLCKLLCMYLYGFVFDFFGHQMSFGTRIWPTNILIGHKMNILTPALQLVTGIGLVFSLQTLVRSQNKGRLKKSSTNQIHTLMGVAIIKERKNLGENSSFAVTPQPLR